MNLNDLTPNPRNPRKITDKKLIALKKALNEVGEEIQIVYYPGSDRYICFEDGRIFGLFWDKFILGTIDQDGYLKTAILVNGKRKDLKIHQIIAHAFLGPCPIGFVVNHKNGVRTDNRSINLEYVLPADNERHARKVLGKRCLGEKASRSKLTEDQIKAIRLNYYENKPTFKAIADKYNISPAQAQRIVKRQNWNHI